MNDSELAELAHVLAHDLRSPLQVIGGFAEFLGRVYADDLDDRGRECIGFIQDGASRIDLLIEDLLAYCRAGTGETVTVPVDLNELVEKLRIDLEPEIVAAGAIVTADPLPVVAGDPDQILEILRILVENAVKFRSDDVPAVVHVDAERCDGTWVVSVSDNGIGIEEKYRSRVFDVFYRLHSRERYEGTGIGLAIARRLVEGIGGSIWVEAAATGGCRFRFSLGAAEI